MDQCKLKDKKEEEELEKYLEQFKKDSNFSKLMEHNRPLWLIFVACVCSAAAGFTQPYMGVVFAKVMNLLTVPMEFFAQLKGPDYLEDETNYWVI